MGDQWIGRQQSRHVQTTPSPGINLDPHANLPISIALSNPATIQRPSFLRLPPELRLDIYELLYGSDQPIRFLAAIHPPENDTVTMSVDRLSTEFLQRVGFGLLQTCRQVYHEVSNVLYGANHFHFTLDPKEDESSWDNATLEIEGLIRWGGKIGKMTMSRVTRITIVLPRLCSCDGYNRTVGRDVSILPLVQLRWHNPNLSVRFAIDDSKETFHIDGQHDVASPQYSVWSPDTLSKALETLSTHPGVKKLARVMDDMCMTRDGSQLSIWYLPSRSGNIELFKLSDNGRILEKVYDHPEANKPHLTGIPWNLQLKIVAEAVAFPNGVLVQHLSRPSLGVLGVNKQLNESGRNVFFAQNFFIFEEHSNELCTSFSDFSAYFSWLRRANWGKKDQTENGLPKTGFSMNFALAGNYNPDEIRVNIGSFVQYCHKRYEKLKRKKRYPYYELSFKDYLRSFQAEEVIFRFRISTVKGTKIIDENESQVSLFTVLDRATSALENSGKGIDPVAPGIAVWVDRQGLVKDISEASHGDDKGRSPSARSRKRGLRANKQQRSRKKSKQNR